MSLTTDNGKMAVMDWQSECEPGCLISVAAFDTDIQQGLIWGIPEVSYGAPSTPTVTPERVPPEVSKGVAGRLFEKDRKRRRILDDDEQFLRMVMASLPEIIRKYYSG